MGRHVGGNTENKTISISRQFILSRINRFNLIVLTALEVSSHHRSKIPFPNLILPSFYQPHIGRNVSRGDCWEHRE